MNLYLLRTFFCLCFPFPASCTGFYWVSPSFTGWRHVAKSSLTCVCVCVVQDSDPRHQRGAQGAGPHVHAAPQVGQAADQAGHPQHGRRGHHAARTASPRSVHPLLSLSLYVPSVAVSLTLVWCFGFCLFVCLFFGDQRGT